MSADRVRVRHHRARWRRGRRYRRRQVVAMLIATIIIGGGITLGVTLSGGPQGSRPSTSSALDAATTLPPLSSNDPAPSSSTRATRTADPQPPPTSTPGAPGIAIATPDDAQPVSDLPDPSLIQVGNSYYLYLSTALGNLTRKITVVPGSPGNWDWAAARDAMPDVPAWAAPDTATSGGQIWEPEVFTFGSTYVMYTSPRVGNYNPETHCIGVATSESPLGPFVPLPNPIVCQLPLGGDIDAQAFFDPSGPNGPLHPYYLVWKSDNNNLQSGDRLTHFWAQGLSNNGLQVTGSPVSMFAADEPWQQGLVEAPQLYTAPGGTIYLFYSGGQCFCSAQYGMGVARCASVFGPCTDLSSNPLITTNAQGQGPGEETLFVGPDQSVWLLYNPWYTGNIAIGLFRPVEATRVGFGPLGPYVAAAGSFPDPYPKLNAKHPVRPSD